MKSAVKHFIVLFSPGHSKYFDKKPGNRTMPADAVEAGDIVLDEGDEATEGDGAVGGPRIVEPNDGGDLEAENQHVERADDGHATGEAGSFKKPACDRVRLAVEPNKPPGAEDIERLCPKKRDHREREKGDFKRGHGLVDFGWWRAG